jgi:prophage antirepressor-like protein
MNNFINLIHIENSLYCLNDIAEKLICSKNIKEYIKKINNKKWIKGNYYISKEDMIIILSKCKTDIGKQYLEYINNQDKPKENNIKIEKNIDLNNFIHIENDLYCLNDIAEKLIYTKNIKRFMDKIINKKLIHGNYYITKNDMNQLLVKYNSNLGQQYINFLNDKNKYIKTSKDLQIENKKFIDYEKNEIIYKNISIFFIEHNADLYFKAKDVCDLLGYTNCADIINKHIDKEDIFLFDNISKQLNNDTIFVNDFGFGALITSSNLPEEEIQKIKHWFTSDILVSIHKTNSYNKIYDEVKLKELENIPCVYLIHVKDSLYKFGQTKQSFRRMNDHKKNLLYNHIRQIYELPTLDLALNIEKNIKKYTQREKIRRYIEQGNEFFEINRDYPIERVLKEINEIVDNEISIYHIKLRLDEYDRLITIEKEKTKQAELEKETKQLEIRKQELDIRKQELELELFKLKENKQQSPIDINITVENIRSPKPKTKKCADCSNMIYNKSTRCHKCLTKFRLNTAIRVNNRPTLEQLEAELNNHTFVNVGKKYGVSDNTIRSWIKQYKKYN